MTVPSLSAGPDFVLRLREMTDGHRLSARGLPRGRRLVGDRRRDVAGYGLLNGDGPVDGRAVAED